jgi:hypothetical protein
MARRLGMEWGGTSWRRKWATLSILVVLDSSRKRRCGAGNGVGHKCGITPDITDSVFGGRWCVFRCRRLITLLFSDWQRRSERAQNGSSIDIAESLRL